LKCLNVILLARHSLTHLLIPLRKNPECTLYQKVYQGHIFDKAHLQKEIGDLLWFIAELCTINDLKLSDVAQMNIDKLKARYPEGFEISRSLHRKDGDI